MATLYVVETPIGNLSDFSPRGIKTLESVSLIAAEDTRQTLKILNKFAIKTPMISYHKYNEQERASEIIGRMQNENIDVALVSDAGTPAISDPGAVLVKLAHETNITVICISGPSALVSALSVSGLDLTDFAFYGFLPRTNSDIEKVLNNIESTPIKTFAIYESPLRILKTLELLKMRFKGATVAVCNDLSKLHERTLYGSVESIYDNLKTNENTRKGEYVIVLEKSEVLDNEVVKVEQVLSIESQLTDIMIKNECTLKTAQALLYDKSKYGKKEIYSASLNLKKLF